MASHNNETASDLYTFIMDYRGGTYISQVVATSPKAAATAWAQQIDYREIWGMGAATKAALVDAAAEDTPTPLEGPKNVWCLFFLLRGHSCLVNLVRTMS